MATRRDFIAATTAASYARVLGANDRVRVGVIGTGGRGQYLMKEMKRIGTVDIPAVCDVYNVRRDQAATIAGAGTKTFERHEQVLELKDVDAVVVATPDHWHSAITVAACEAGKDVYVEKPMVHYPSDGQAIVRAAKKHGRIIQVGMQARAIPHFQEARQRFVESGAMGKVGLVRTWYNENRGYLLKPPPGMEQKPEGLNWDRWLGPGPNTSWNPDIYFSPYKWLHYDGGMIMGIGIHVIDSAHQFMKLSKPLAASAAGGIYHFTDRDSPDVVSVMLDYPQKVTVTFEAEILSTGTSPSSEAGLLLRGTGGHLLINRYDSKMGWQYKPSKASSQPAASGPGDPPNADHLIRNWLECIRTRQKPVANEVEGYYSSVACFMGREAIRLRKRVEWDPGWDL